MEELLKELSEAQQRQQVLISRLNQIEMEKAQLTQEVFKLQGQIELLQRLTQVEGGRDAEIIAFSSKEKPE